MTLSLSPFPRMALGSMYFGTTIDEPVAWSMMDMFLDAGEAMIDTANNYAFWHAGTQGGESETTIGRWLSASKRRNEVIIATKIGARPRIAGGDLDDTEGLDSQTVRSTVIDSIRRLGVDSIDVCYAHIDDHDVPLEETLGAFDDLIREGLVRHIAASNMRADRLRQALHISHQRDLASYVALQQRHSIIAAKSGSDFGVQETTDKDVLEIVREENLRLVAYSPMLGGALASSNRPLPDEYNTQANTTLRSIVTEAALARNISVSRLVLATLMHQSITPLTGARTPEQLTDSLAARTERLSGEEIARFSVQPTLSAST